MKFILILAEGDVTNASEVSLTIDGKDVHAVPITLDKDDYWRTSAESLGIIVQKSIQKLLT